jgi:drug/metabolite transporter (DMT)-like permease
MSLSRAAAVAAPLLFVFMWSTGFIGTKYGLPYAEPLTFLVIRLALVIVLLTIIAWIGRVPMPGWRQAGHSAVTGLLLHGIYLSGVFISMAQGLPAGVIAMVCSLQPILGSTIAGRWLGESVRPLQWLGLALGLGGVALVLHERTFLGPGDWIGWTGSFVALFAISIGTLYQKRFGGNVDWRSGNLVQYIAAFLLVGSGALLFETQTIRWTGELIFAIAWLVLVLSIGAVGVMYWIIRRAPAASFSSLFYLVPAVTAGMAYLLFGEKLDALSLAGMAICAVGVILVNRGAARTARTA